MFWKSRSWRRIHIALAIMFIAVFTGMFLYAHDAGGKRRSVYEMGERFAGCDLKLVMAKDWSEEAHGYKYGMQYDGVLVNNTPYKMEAWEVQLQLIDDCYIDSFWNGEMVLEGSTLTAEPLDYNFTIEPGGQQTFGFVLYASSLDSVQDGTVSVRKVVKVTSMPLFWFMLAALLVFVTVEFTNTFNAARTRRLAQRQEEFLGIVNQSFLTFANIIDAKDNYTKGHSQRVAIYSRELAKRMGLGEDECRNLFYIALMHDIGKIGISDAVLKKTGRLTEEERREIERHVLIGGDILQDFTAIEGIGDGARYHHERFDGTGYMSGKKGMEIPLFARIICVADAFDAMSSRRCYRGELPIEFIVEELKKCAGTQFDPEIVVHMLAMIEEGTVPIKGVEESLKTVLTSISRNL